MSFYQQRNARGRIHVSIAQSALPSSATAAAQRRLSACMCIDASGSMAGDFAAVLDAVRYIRDAAKRCVPSWILYAGAATLLAGGADELLTKQADGMTCFAAAIDCVCAWLASLPADEPAVVAFMTDGRNTVNPPPDDALARLRALVAARGAPVQIHCIGFSASCDKVFLARLAEAGSPGSACRAAAHRDVLNEQLGDLFDFFDCNLAVNVQLADGSCHTVDAVVVDGVDGAMVQFDLMTSLAALGHASDADTAPVAVRVDGVELVLAARPVDVHFDLTLIESMAATMDRDVLLDALKRLQGVNPAAARRDERDEAWRRKEAVQQRLDATLRVLADSAKAGVGGVAAQLDAIRYDARLLKTRRRRLADKRALTNASRFAALPAAVAPLSGAELDELRALELTCALSGESAPEVLSSASDFLVFACQVQRAEHALEAPSTISVLDLTHGVYSFEAFVQAQQFALQTDADAHESGYFRAADGKRMNACFPLFLSDAHWRRVSTMLPMLLGHSFAMDAMAFREDMYIALYSLLGQLLARRARGELAVSEWSEFVLADLARTCAAVRPRLRRWLFASQFAGGVVRGDLLQEFLERPRARLPDCLASLYVIVGLAHIDRDAQLAALSERLAAVADGGVGDMHLATAALTSADAAAAAAEAAAEAAAAAPPAAPLPGASAERSVRTALALLVPAAQCGAIEAVRAAHDPAFARWPPHANLLFPFLADACAVDAALLAQLDVELARRVPTFRVTLARFDVFPSSGTLYLRLDTEPRDVLDVAYRVAAALFPQCVRGGGGGGGGGAREFHPHVTVARSNDIDALNALAAQLRQSWTPIEFECARLSVLTRGADDDAAGRFVESHAVPLAPSGSINLRPNVGPRLLRGAVEFDEHRLTVTLVEELWRRALRNHFRGHPATAVDAHLELLLYGAKAVAAAAAAAAEPGDDAAADADDDDDDGALNDRALEQAFIQWAEFEWDEIGKKRSQVINRKGAPKFAGLLADGAAFEQRTLVALDDSVTCDAEIEALLALIQPACDALAGVTGDASRGRGSLSRRERFLMMVQALHHCGAHATTQVEQGRWLNTLDATPAELLEPIHAAYEAARREKWAAVLADKNAQTMALSMARCRSKRAFCGRALVACTTRGGRVFDMLVALLCTDPQWPELQFKMRCILTGKYLGDTTKPLFGGLAWVHCAANTALRIREIMGKAEFAAVELQMHGRVGWVYRESNIPNRHGHSNVHPNPALTRDFDGFELDKIVKQMGVQF
jgi:2'-5' RNA ligase